jgi:O-antigen/teichoic acid export membrane protein
MAAVSSAKGSLQLFIGKFVSLLATVAGSIFVARLLSPSEYGLYSVSLVLPTLFGLVSDWGVNSALTRFIALYRSEKEHSKIMNLEKAGFVFKSIVGSILSCLLFLSSGTLATILLRRPEVGDLVRMASVLVLSQSMHSTTMAVLAGLERMDHMAVVNVSQAVTKGLCSPLLVYFGFGVCGAILGHVLSYSVAAVVGFFFGVSSSPKHGIRDVRTTEVRESLGVMLGFGLPLFMGSLIVSFSRQFRGLLLSYFVSDEAIGNYGVASRFMSIIGIVTASIGETLFPAFSKFSYTENAGEIQKAFEHSVKYLALIVFPFTALLAILSEPVIYTFFTSKYVNAPVYLSLLLLPMLLVGTGSLSIGNFLNSQGDTKTTTSIWLAESATIILVYPVLISYWNIFGFIAGILLSSLVQNLFSLYMLHRKYGINPDFAHAGKTLVSAGFSAGIAYGLLQLLSNSTPFLSLLLGSTTFLIAYLVLAPITGALKSRDIENLDFILKELKIIYPFARRLLLFEKKILEVTSKRQK